MEKFDVAIIGGGSAGLSALKHLSDLGKQAVLIEAGSQIGTKNVSGGIIYSKKPSGKVYNVEDIYGQDFVSVAPIERLITKYMMHATSGRKVFSIDLTSVHKYQTNFGYSVLLSKLNSWFASRASEAAEKLGGGIVSGVHVNSIQWLEDDSTIIYTDELAEFQVKAIIASDGVNSEIAEMTQARQKFTPKELYQGVKVVIKLPEDIIQERFSISSTEGAAHLFAGDITKNHIGGGFLYTNRDTLSLGAVYHYNSLMLNPAEPSTLVNTLIEHPLIGEYIKDEILLESVDKSVSKEEQLRTHLTLNKLMKTYNELRDAYYSQTARTNLVKSGRYKDIDGIRIRLDSLRKDITEKFGAEVVTNYVELEYSAKLVPDGKRCRMKKPYYKNILFVGDAAGRGIFIGPRIEGLNVGIDDAARAAIAVSRAIDKNNFKHDHFGEYYTSLIEDSPYTRDMTKIDKGYLSTFLDATKKIPRDIIGSRYGLILKLMSSGKIRGFAINFANLLGWEKILPFVESEDTYVKLPMELANKLGKEYTSSYTPLIPSLSDRVAKLKYNDDHISHIRVNDPRNEFMKKLVILCPTTCYSIEGENVVLQHEGCIECGSCAKWTEWKHPRGEKGICFAYG